MNELENLRKEIDEVDKELVKLFEKRMEVVLKIVEYKKANDIPIFNSSRENEIIRKNTEYLNNKHLEKWLKDFFTYILKISKEFQNEKISNI